MISTFHILLFHSINNCRLEYSVFSLSTPSKEYSYNLLFPRLSSTEHGQFRSGFSCHESDVRSVLTIDTLDALHGNSLQAFSVT